MVQNMRLTPSEKRWRGLDGPSRGSPHIAFEIDQGLFSPTSNATFVPELPL